MIKRFVAVLLTLLVFGMFGIDSTCYAARVSVKEGKRISIIAKEKYSSKNISSGDKLNAYIEYDVNINGQKVFKEGDNAELNVSDVRKARCWGVPGEILLINGRVTDANGELHRIEFQQKITGEEKNWPKVMGAVSIFFLFPLALFGFVKGEQAEVVPNKPFTVILTEDFVFVPNL